MKHCAHCRLHIRQPGAVFAASHEGQPFAFMICLQCHGRLSKLPPSTRYKAFNHAANTVVSDPVRYACRAFNTDIEAQIFAGLAGDMATSADVVNDLLV
jgi:hypothetical protein